MLTKIHRILASWEFFRNFEGIQTIQKVINSEKMAIWSRVSLQILHKSSLTGPQGRFSSIGCSSLFFAVAVLDTFTE